MLVAILNSSQPSISATLRFGKREKKGTFPPWPSSPSSPPPPPPPGESEEKKRKKHKSQIHARKRERERERRRKNPQRKSTPGPQTEGGSEGFHYRVAGEEEGGRRKLAKVKISVLSLRRERGEGRGGVAGKKVMGHFMVNVSGIFCFISAEHCCRQRNASLRLKT